MHRFVSVLLITFFISSSVAAEELEAGKVYGGGSTVSSKVLGTQLKIPKNWKGAVSGEFFVIGSDTKPGLVAVIADEGTMAEAKAFASTAQELGDGYIFSPTAKPTVSKDTLVVPCKISNGVESLQGELTIRVGKHGISMGVIAAAKEGDFATVKKVADAVAKSVSFKKPFKPSPGKSSGKWVKEVAGKKLNLFNSSGGFDSSYTSHVVLTICSDGSFARDRESGGYSNGLDVSVSHAGQSQYFGKWSVVGPKLHLFYNDGDKAEYDLTFNDKGHFLMNGTRWLREGANCR